MKLFDRLGNVADSLQGVIDTPKTKADADLLKAQAITNLASQPAQKTNPLLIIIPVAVLLIGGVTAFILLRKKKG